jgi:hypothetical protein
MSTTYTAEYCTLYRIPQKGNGTTATDALKDMFTNTGGTFTGTPEINTTYYISNEGIPTIIIYSGSVIASLKAGQTATVKTANTEVDYDIVVKAAEQKEVALQEKSTDKNGAVLPDLGYDGLSKVNVNVTPKLQEKSTDKNGEVVPDTGYDGLSKVTVNVVSADSPLPIEVATEAEMASLLETADVGSVYKYVGETGAYENGALYLVEGDGLISFTIDGTTYYAEEGMTWEAWVASEYNTNQKYNFDGSFDSWVHSENDWYVYNTANAKSAATYDSDHFESVIVTNGVYATEHETHVGGSN